MTFNKLSKKDKKTIRVGGLLIAIILACGGLNILLKEYSETSKKLEAARTKFGSILPASDGSLNRKQAGLYKIVPVFEVPEKEDIPGSKFQKTFLENLKKAGIKSTVLNLQPMSNKRNAVGFRTRNLHCKGKCNFGQAMDLVASLYKNPLFVGIKEFKVECDAKNKKIMELTITVSTFVK
jgi:hypothetical protein